MTLGHVIWLVHGIQSEGVSDVDTVFGNGISAITKGSTGVATCELADLS